MIKWVESGREAAKADWRFWCIGGSGVRGSERER